MGQKPNLDMGQGVLHICWEESGNNSNLLWMGRGLKIKYEHLQSLFLIKIIPCSYQCIGGCIHIFGISGIRKQIGIAYKCAIFVCWGKGVQISKFNYY